MAWLTEFLLPCVYAFLASMGFCVLFNIHTGVLICCTGGALGWLVYLLMGILTPNDLIQSFVAAIFIAAYSEIMARIRKCPVTGYLLVAFFPLVPGGGIYYSMEYAIAGETQLFLSTGSHTLGLAGTLAMGVLLVSTLVRMINTVRAHRARLAVSRG
ncbi:MAG: threonine/serine exporter family protein [Pseudoflavonifractor sp.]